jgi:tetratricopeptide (TPR) repeat protein
MLIALSLIACAGETRPPEVIQAQTLDEAGKPEEARAILEKAESAHLDKAVYSFELAMLSLKHFDEFFKGKIRTIIITNKNFKPFGRAVRMNDVDGTELGYLLRDLSPAIEILDRAIGRDRKYTQAWLEKANCQAEMGNPDSALLTLSNARRVLPDEARIPYLEGSILLHLGQVIPAERAFGEASKKNSDDPAAALWHGITLLTLDKGKEAEAAFNRAISLAKTSAEKDAERAVHEMFTWYYERQKYEECTAWGKKHISIAKTQPKLFRALAIAAFMAGRYDDARTWLPEAIQKGGDDALALALLGQIHTTDGKYAEAETIFRRSLKIKETVQVLSQLGSLYLEKLKQPEQAITVLERTIAIQPGHYLARFQLASAMRAAGRDASSELAAWRAYLASASAIARKDLADHEAQFIKKAQERIAELEK